MSSEFSSELDTSLLIEEVESRPCLYERKHEKFADVLFKRKEWEMVAKALFKRGWRNYDEDEKREKVELVQKRWKNLRAGFIREFKRQKDLSWLYDEVSYKKRKCMNYNHALSFLIPECYGTDKDTITSLPECYGTDKNPMTTFIIDYLDTTDDDDDDDDDGSVNIDAKIKDILFPASRPKAKTNKTKTNDTKSASKSNNTKTPSHSDDTNTPSNSDNTETLSNSGNTDAPSSSDNTTTLSNSDNFKTTNAKVYQDSTNFALSLVPMINLIPIDERIDAQMKILSVLQPFLKKSRDEGERDEGERDEGERDAGERDVTKRRMSTRLMKRERVED